VRQLKEKGKLSKSIVEKSFFETNITPLKKNVGKLKLGGLASLDNPCEGTKGTEWRLASLGCSQNSGSDN